MSDRPLFERLDETIDAILVGDRETSADPTISALTDILTTLRYLPDDRFKARLGRELQIEFQRRKPMTASAPFETSKADFASIHTVTPFICVPEGEELIEFMKETFDAEETGRHPHHGPDGFVASVRLGDSDLLIMGGESLRGQETPAALHVYVKDCDATYRRALNAGAVTLGRVGEPADRPYGERAAFVADRFGNIWFIATRVGVLGHVTPCMLPSVARPLVDFLKSAFGARMEGVHEASGRMVHAFVRVGEVQMEMSEVEKETARPFAFYLHTNDVDAVYHRALEAGATPILPPADQSYGDRLAIVQDPTGNRWFAAKRIVSS